MLPKEYRLVKDQEIKRLAARGRKFAFGAFFIKTAINNLKVNRFCFSISTKVDKRATKRNLLKRRFSEIIYPLLPKMRTGLDFLIMPKKEATLLTYQQLEEQVNLIFQKMRLL